jgi:hypothetical protein
MHRRIKAFWKCYDTDPDIELSFVVDKYEEDYDLKDIFIELFNDDAEDLIEWKIEI